MKKLLSALCLVLSACGGGGGSTAPAPATAVVAIPAVVIVATGDSTEAGLLPDIHAFRPPSIEAQRILRAVLGRQDITISNQGIPGSTAEQLLQATDGFGQTFSTRIQGATIVTIKHGINGTASPQEHAATLRALITAARNQGVKVLLETPGPVVLSPNVSPALQAAVLARADATRQVASETSTPLCDHDLYYRTTGKADLAHFPDGMHASMATYDEIGERKAVCLGPLL